MEYLYDLIEIGKYIVGIIGIIGIIVLLIGLFRSQRELITRGGYLIILSLVLGVCGYFLYKGMIERAKERIYFMESSLTGNY